MSCKVQTNSQFDLTNKTRKLEILRYGSRKSSGVRLYSRPTSLRMPFHFGNAKIEYLECALLRTIVEDEHGTSLAELVPLSSNVV